MNLLSQVPPQMSSSSGRPNKVLNNSSTQSESKKADDRLDDYVFCEVKGSKFFSKPTNDVSSNDSDSEYDDQYDSFISEAEKSKNVKKRKQIEDSLETNKKLNRKTTPKSKKK